jgi:RNA polymerase sigma factor (TIGR02999 family)
LPVSNAPTARRDQSKRTAAGRFRGHTPVIPLARLSEIRDNPEMTDPADVTRLLQRLGDGDPDAGDALMQAIYAELRTLAAGYLRRERAGHTLQPTALVNEAYLRLVDQRNADYQSRGHFLAVAAMVMRRILVNHAQAKAAAKRGGGAARVPLADDVAVSPGTDLDVLALDEALKSLARLDERKARVVEQRFFAGMEMSQIAENLGVSLATVKRDWEFARTWLAREMQAGD